jgi:LAO/AO transport system kinase
MGDSVQAAKAGILEIADIFVVNKSDRPGAQEAVRDLRTMLAMAPHRDEGVWKPPIVSASAASGEGIDELVGRLDEHAEWLAATGERDRKRRARARDEISAMAIAGLTRRLGALPGEANLEKLAGLVASGKLDPYSAADELISG